MKDNDERELRGRFVDLRRHDEDAAPSFAALIRKSRHAKVKTTVTRPRRSLLLLGACAAAFAIVAVWSSHRANSAPTPQDIAEWRPRSDALLDGARRTLLVEMPPLSASVLDTILH